MDLFSYKNNPLKNSFKILFPFFKEKNIDLAISLIIAFNRKSNYLFISNHIKRISLKAVT